MAIKQTTPSSMELKAPTAASNRTLATRITEVRHGHLESEFKPFKNHRIEIPEPSSCNDIGFHKLIYPVVVMAQCFAIIPINSASKTGRDVKFQFVSLKFVYFLLVWIGIGVVLLLTMAWLFKNRMEFGKIVGLLFYGFNFSCYASFGLLAFRWRKLMTFWENIEQKLPPFQSVKERNQLGRQIKIICFIVMSSALLEHLLAIINGIHNVTYCSNVANPVEAYFKQNTPQLYYFTSYHIVIAIWMTCINIYCTFSWNFMDLFIIIVSVGLTTRLRQINSSIYRAKTQTVSKDFWETHRLFYQFFNELLTRVDLVLGPIILLSFANNLYFVCVQLLNSLTPSDNAVHAIYFWYSLFFLIARTFSVSLYSSKIHDESLKPIGMIQEIPKSGWNDETERLLEQIRNDKTALSGMKYFHLTRSLILKIAGTIVTYELVLIQFSSADEEITDKDPCT